MMVCGNALACTVFLDEGEPTVKVSTKQLHYSQSLPKRG